MNRAVLTLTTIAAIAAGACTSGGPAERAQPVAPLEVTTATAATVALPATFDAGGIVVARLSAAIASRVMAPIVEVRVRPGDRVRRGAPLVSLDAREMLANRDRAAAAATAATESTVASDADVAAADAHLGLARATHQRISDLASRKSATPQELDQAAAALAGADAQLRAAQARRSAAAANRDAARAGVGAAEAGLSYTQLTAPFDGVVTERAVDPGAMATPGIPLLTLEDVSTFRLEVRLDESRAAQVQVGQPVDVAFDDGVEAPRAWTAARVTEIAHVDPASHTFLVKIDLPQREGLRSGTFARARFSGVPRTVLAVPTTSVVRRGQLAFVFAVDAGHIARLRAISAGEPTITLTQVLAGIAEGDTIVLDPPPALTDGHPVRTTGTAARGEAR